MDEPATETLVGTLHISDFRGYENVEFQQELNLPPGSYNVYAHISESTGSEDSPSDESSLEEVKELAYDAVSGMKYIEYFNGRLYGVGWDRVFEKADKIFPLKSGKKWKDDLDN
jgi:hypothetical protein